MRKCDKEGGVHLTGQEADLVLYAYDNWLRTDTDGRITNLFYPVQRGHTVEDAQHLRDKLFVAHEHPGEE